MKSIYVLKQDNHLKLIWDKGKSIKLVLQLLINQNSFIMKNFLLLLICSAFFCLSCNQNDHSNKPPNSFFEDEGDDQDGIREAQEMEFELTKDIRLGYVPKDRLIRAYNDEIAFMRRGGYANRTSALTWTERGPFSDEIAPSNGNTRGPGPATDAVTSGRIRAIWFDLKDPTDKIVWVGGVSGGIWKTTDITSSAASVWSPAGDFLDNIAVSAICQDPTDTDIMYYGTGEKTNNADRVQGGGIWKSTNNGVSWNFLANTINYTNVSQMICDAAGNVYVATVGSGNGILRSSDKGATWANITPSGLSSNVTEMKLSSTGRLHISCGYRDLVANSGYRYTDNPGTVSSASGWNAPATTYPADFNVEIAVAGNVLYALPSNTSGLTPTIYKSSDGGVNWAATTTSPPGTSSEPTINAGQGWYDLAIGVDPNNPNNVFAGGLNFYKTTDGGTTWSQFSRWVGTDLTLKYIHADHHNVVWKGTKVIMGTDGGLFYSSDNGVTFADRNDGLRLKQFYACAIHPTLTNFFLAGAQDNGTHKLQNAGLSSSIEVHGGDGAYVHIDQNEPQYQFSAVTRGQYRRSTNGGVSFSSVNYSSTVGQFINPTDYDDVANIMYTSAATGQYVRWDDAQTGSSFTPVSIAEFGGASTRSINVSPHTANRVFFGCFNGRVVRVDNANAATPTATNIAGSGMTSNVSCVAIGVDDNNLMATFSNYGAAHVWVTTTGGGASGWTNVSGNLPDIPVRWAMFHPEDNSKAMIATELGVYETDNLNGSSTIWVRNTSFPFVKTNMLQYRASDRTVLAATHGRGLYTATIPPASPFIRFIRTEDNGPETTVATASTCRKYKEYSLDMTIAKAPVGTATVTLAVNAGATATEGTDYDITTNGNFAAPSKVITFADGLATPQTILVRIYDDAEVEMSEQFTLSYTISGTTDAIPSATNQTYTFTISDNDVAPVALGGPTNFAVDGNDNISVSNASPFRAEKPLHRIQNIYLASELVASGITRAALIHSITYTIITKGSLIPFGDVNISLKNSTRSDFATGGWETGLTNVYTAAIYNTVAGTNTFTFSSPFSWDGTSNIVLELCYTNAIVGVNDVVKGSSAPLGVGIRPSLYSNQATPAPGSGCDLPTAFVNDNRADLIFNASVSGNAISTAASTTATEYLASNGTFHFYSGQDIIAKLSAVSANIGCVTSTISEAGNTWQTYQGGQRSQKVFDITPSSNAGASYNVGIYFTADELAGKNPSTLSLAKTTAATISASDGSNTDIITPTVTSLGTGYVFNGSFTGFSKFFLVDNNVVLPINLLSLSGFLNANEKGELFWQANKPANFKHFEIERSYDGTVFTQAGIVPGSLVTGTAQNYTFTDAQKAKSVNFYRLKMVDKDGRFTYSASLKIINPKTDKFVELLGNPVSSSITILVNNAAGDNLRLSLTSATGQIIKRWQPGNRQGSVSLPIADLNLASGNYYLKVIAGIKKETLVISKQ